MKKILIQQLFITTLMILLPYSVSAEESKSTAAATPRQSTMIILDGSNSMWGQLQGINKIVTARESLATLLENAHGNIDFGLLTYGNRRKSSCSDFTLVSKPEDYDQKTMLRNIRRMKPYGRSPIADALKKAAASLPQQNAHILLVSDGEESCGGDPCAVAKELRRSNPDLQIDVIGFRDEKEAQLECIAENGNGAFVFANNTERLKTLLAGVQAKAISVMATSEPVAPAASEDLPGSVEISIRPGQAENQIPRANFSIYTPDGNIIASFTSRVQVKEYLKPGTYRVKAQWQGKSYTENVTIQPGKTSNLQFNAGQSGMLKLSALDAENKPVKVNYSIYLTNGNFISRHVYQDSVNVRIPSTEYRIKAVLDDKILEKTLLVESDADNTYVFRFE
jgi:Ca-activated chloride channel family protein